MINVRGTISNPTICLIKCKSLLIWLQNIQRWIGPGPFSLMTLHNPHMYLYFVLHLTLPLSTSLFLQFSEPNPTAPTCEPSLEGGATPPYPPMLQLRLLLNWPLWCGHDHKKLVFKFPFLSICDEQCVLDRFYSIARKNLSNFTVFLELVFTSKAFFTPHYNQSDSCPPAYSPRREAGHICWSFGNPEKLL